MSIELLSFDWDYCVPIHADNDWGHAESKMFFEDIWRARIGVFSTQDGELKQLEMGNLLPDVKFPRVFIPFRFGIGESHMHAFEHFLYTIKQGVKGGQALDMMNWRIHHYDLHHDIWPFDPENPQIVQGDNWLHHLVHWIDREFPSSKIEVIWHTPSWFKEQGYDVENYNWSKYKRLMESLYNVQLTHVQDGEELGQMNPTAAFICRSGAWTPPHLDPYFIMVCKDIMDLISEESNRSQLNPVRVYKAYNETVDPLVPRKFDYIALDALEKLKLPTEERNNK